MERQTGSGIPIAAIPSRSRLNGASTVAGRVPRYCPPTTRRAQPRPPDTAAASRSSHTSRWGGSGVALWPGPFRSGIASSRQLRQLSPSSSRRSRWQPRGSSGAPKCSSSTYRCGSTGMGFIRRTPPLPCRWPPGSPWIQLHPLPSRLQNPRIWRIDSEIALKRSCLRFSGAGRK